LKKSIQDFFNYGWEKCDFPQPCKINDFGRPSLGSAACYSTTCRRDSKRSEWRGADAGLRRMRTPKWANPPATKSIREIHFSCDETLLVRGTAIVAQGSVPIGWVV